MNNEPRFPAVPAAAVNAVTASTAGPISSAPPNSKPVGGPIPWALVRFWAARYFPMWCLLAAVIFIVQTVLSAMLHERENLVQFLKMLDMGPAKIFKTLIGGDELMPGNILGIVAIGYQHPLILICMMISSGAMPTGMLTSEAERGTMEILLSRSLTRRQVFWTAAVLSVLYQVALVAVIFLGTAVWTRFFDYGEAIPLAPFARATINRAALSATTVALSLLCSVFFSDRGTALGVLIGYLVLTYLLQFAASLWSKVAFLKPWTLFNYCVPNAVIRNNAIPWDDMAVLGTVFAISIGLAFFIWNRKDIAAA